MKRAALLALMLCTACTACWAQGQSEVGKKSIPLRRYLLANGQPGFRLVSGTAGYVDSTQFSVMGTSPDTTAPFTFRGEGDNWVRENVLSLGTSGAGVDSVWLFTAILRQADQQLTGNTGFFDITAIVLQGSWDGGLNWVSSPSFNVQEATGANSAVRAFCMPARLEQVASTLTTLQVASCPLLRLIYTGSGNNTGLFQCDGYYPMSRRNR